MLGADEISGHIDSAPVAMAVLDTTTGEITAANQAYADLHGVSRESVIGLKLHEYLEGERLAAAQSVVDSIRQGWIDSLEGHVEFRRADGTTASAYSWTVPLGSKPPHDSALLGAAPARGERRAGFDAYRVKPSRVVLGALDHDWRFSDVAVQGAALLGWPSGEEGRARLHEMVHPADAPVVLASLGRAAIGHDATTVRARVRGADGGWLAAFITVSPLCAHVSPRFGLAISLLDDGRESDDLDWTARIEGQLLRLATEVRVGGGAMSSRAATADVDLSGFTKRQAEIVARLLRGQRVDGIAHDLFLSPSTVRNHLSSVFRQLGVKSQSQLIERLHSHRNSGAD